MYSHSQFHPNTIPYPKGHADYEEIDETCVPPDQVIRTFSIYNTGTHINYRIHLGNSESPCTYYVNNSMFTPGTADVQLRRGDSKGGEQVASGKFHNLSGNVTIGFRQGGQEAHAELTKISTFKHDEYNFEYAAEALPGGPSQRTKYVWRRTLGKGLHANYTCIQASIGRVVAYFLNSGNKSWKKLGGLQITIDQGEVFDQILLVTLLCIREKESRNAWYTGGILFGTSHAAVS